MTDEAASTDSAAPNVATMGSEGAPPPAADQAPSRDELAGKRLERQIAKALKSGKPGPERSAEKPAVPPRGPGGKFQKTGTSASTNAAEGAAAQTTAPVKEPAAKVEKQPAGPTKSPRELLEAGDLDAAFEAAFGKKPQDFKIDSRRWEEWRKAQTRGKQSLEREKQALSEANARDRRELEQTLAGARRELGPLLEGQKLFKAGDFAGALKIAFGVDVATFQRSLLAQHHGKNPEVEAIRAELKAEREERARREQELERQRAEQTQREQLALYTEQVRGEIVDGEDAQLAGLATDPAFIEQVIQIQRRHYDPATRTTMPALQAAAQVRDAILARFGKVLGHPRDTAVTVESAQPGSKAANGGARKATTSLPQRGAAEASAGRRRSVGEMLSDYTERAKAEAGLPH